MCELICSVNILSGHKAQMEQECVGGVDILHVSRSAFSSLRRHRVERGGSTGCDPRVDLSDSFWAVTESPNSLNRERKKKRGGGGLLKQLDKYCSRFSARWIESYIKLGEGGGQSQPWPPPFPTGRVRVKECRVGETPRVAPITATSHKQIYEDISLACPSYMSVL